MLYSPKKQLVVDKHFSLFRQSVSDNDVFYNIAHRRTRQPGAPDLSLVLLLSTTTAKTRRLQASAQLVTFKTWTASIKAGTDLPVLFRQRPRQIRFQKRRFGTGMFRTTSKNIKYFYFFIKNSWMVCLKNSSLKLP